MATKFQQTFPWMMNVDGSSVSYGTHKILDSLITVNDLPTILDSGRQAAIAAIFKEHGWDVEFYTDPQEYQDILDQARGSSSIPQPEQDVKA